MDQTITILMLEDAPADAVMIQHELRAGGLSFRAKRVDTKEGFLSEIYHHRPDIIVSDHGLPEFDGFGALAVARRMCPDIPFIFVTGSVGEELVVEMMQSGAMDCVLKQHLHTRLVPAIRRALLRAEERRARRQAQRALQANEERLRLLVEGVKDYAICMLDPQGLVVYWNSGAEQILGYTNQEILGRHYSCFFPPDESGTDQPAYALYMASTEGRYEQEGPRLRKGGVSFEANTMIHSLRDDVGRLRGFSHVISDLTKRRQPQAAPDADGSTGEHLTRLVPQALLVIQHAVLAFVSEEASRLLGASAPAELMGRAFQDIVRPEAWEPLSDWLRRLGAGPADTSPSFALPQDDPRSKLAFTEAELVRLDGSPLRLLLGVASLWFQAAPATLLLIYPLGKS